MKPRIIGWISRDAMSPADAAEAAIAKAREVCGTAPGVLHLDTVTGRLTLLADVNAPIPASTFARGVRFDSDRDVLAADLRSEAIAARLIAGRVVKPKRPRKPKPRKGESTLTPEQQQARRDAVASMTRGDRKVDDICAEHGISKTTLYRWRDAIRGPAE